MGPGSRLTDWRPGLTGVMLNSHHAEILMLVAMGHEWEPREQWVNSMTLLAKEVMPKLADLD